jgi:hypothetical protein
VGQPIGDTEESFVACARQVAMAALTRQDRWYASHPGDGNGEDIQRRIEGMNDLDLVLPKIANKLSCDRNERSGTQ